MGVIQVILFATSGRRARKAGGIMRINQQRGFTLIEIMITIVIVAILAAIGYPIYLHYVQDSRRTSAITALQRAAAAEEKYYAIHNVYPSSLTSLNYSSNSVAVPSAAEHWYTLSSSLDSQGNYILEAAPTGPQANDACGTYKLYATGKKTTDGKLSKCWSGG